MHCCNKFKLAICQDGNYISNVESIKCPTKKLELDIFKVWPLANSMIVLTYDLDWYYVKSESKVCKITDKICQSLQCEKQDIIPVLHSFGWDEYVVKTDKMIVRMLKTSCLNTYDGESIISTVVDSSHLFVTDNNLRCFCLCDICVFSCNKTIVSKGHVITQVATIRDNWLGVNDKAELIDSTNSKLLDNVTQIRSFDESILAVSNGKLYIYEYDEINVRTEIIYENLDYVDFIFKDSTVLLVVSGKNIKIHWPSYDGASLFSLEMPDNGGNRFVSVSVCNYDRILTATDDCGNAYRSLLQDNRRRLEKIELPSALKLQTKRQMKSARSILSTH